MRSQKNVFLDGVLHWFIHEKTKCEILHVSNSDSENMFMFAIPTYPKDDSGVTHILEHSVLSGSDRYQVKSPFFRLEQGSCRTYLNASTYPDRTLYPGASLLKKDLFNLMAMSGDAVWYPLLQETVFRQEGFHFAFDNQDYFQAAGVVYNEMKGEYSDKNTLIEGEIFKKLYPDICYKYDSGGNPEFIPLLNYEDFLSYYKNFYRPEHTKIVLYGNIDSQEYLDFIDKELLSRWQGNCHDSHKIISFQEHKNLCEFDVRGQEKIHFIKVPTSTHASGEEGTLDITWLLGDSSNIIESGLLQFVHFVLLGIPGAPLRKIIMESQLVEDISPLSGSSTYLRQSSYGVGAVGVNPTHYKVICNIIFDGLKKIVAEGISDDITQAALSRIEFSFKERLNSTSRKIGWLSSLASKWLYGKDPFLYADIPFILQQIKNALSVPRALENYIQKNFIENFHRVITATIPHLTYEEERNKKEKLLLNQLLNSKGKEYWKSLHSKIESTVQTPDDEKHIQAIPQIHKHELPREIEHMPYELFTLPNTGKLVQWVPHSDNGVLYITASFDITDMVFENEVRFLLPTFSAALTDIGLMSMAYEDLSIQICLSAGRMGAHINNFVHLDGSSRNYLNIKMSVLEKNQDKAFALVNKIMKEADFENTSRLKEIINEGRAMMKNRLIDSGTMLAVITAAKNYSYSAHIDDAWNGIAQLRWLLALDDYTQASQYLSTMQNNIFTKERVLFTVVGSSKLQEDTLAKLEQFVEKLSSNKDIDNKFYAPEYSIEKDNFGIRARHNVVKSIYKSQAIVLPSQVAYNTLVIPAVGFNHIDYANHNLCSRIISEKLLEEIRMGYGAYGAHSTIMGDEALLVCYTYRDPNIEESFSVFKKVIENVARGDFSTSSLDSHIVGAVGDSLVQMSPQVKSKVTFTRMITGITDNKRQEIRTNLLNANKHDICTIATKYVEDFHKSVKASVCNENMIIKNQWDLIEYAPH